jgi:hypothetical protein
MGKRKTRRYGYWRIGKWQGGTTKKKPPYMNLVYKEKNK